MQEGAHVPNTERAQSIEKNIYVSKRDQQSNPFFNKNLKREPSVPYSKESLYVLNQVTEDQKVKAYQVEESDAKAKGQLLKGLSIDERNQKMSGADKQFMRVLQQHQVRLDRRNNSNNKKHK